MRSSWLTCVVLVVLLRGAMFAQNCPKENPSGPSVDSATRVVHGVLVLHNGLRVWMELLPDTPVCGFRSVQLLGGEGGAFEVDGNDSRRLQVFRGCNATVHGTLGLPGTGYYSAPIYLNVQMIEPAPGCIRKPLLPYYSHIKPAPDVRQYRVLMSVHYRGDGSVNATIQSGNRTLRPWQAYASYSLTGEFVLYGYCATGFVASRVSGTPAAKPWLIDTYVAMDPDSAAAKGVWNTSLRYTCTRYPEGQ